MDRIFGERSPDVSRLQRGARVHGQTGTPLSRPLQLPRARALSAAAATAAPMHSRPMHTRAAHGCPARPLPPGGREVIADVSAQQLADPTQVCTAADNHCTPASPRPLTIVDAHAPPTAAPWLPSEAPPPRGPRVGDIYRLSPKEHYVPY